MTNILILGAGFGGINAALKLEEKLKNNPDIKITLIDRNNFHLFTPSLYEVATVYDLIENSFNQYLRGSVAVPIGEILKNKKINFIQSEIKEIKLKEKYILTGGGARLGFDYLVIALGGETEFYEIPGVRDYAFNFKSADDAIGIYKKIREIYRNYQKEKNNKTIKIAVIGGGFTGVELAAELGCCISNIIKNHKLSKSCTSIELFEAGPTILPPINEKARKIIEKKIEEEIVRIRVNSPVSEVGPDFIKINSDSATSRKRLGGTFDEQDRGERLNFDLIIWAGGIHGSKLLENLGLKLTKKKTVEINEFLQTKNLDDSVNDKIFAIGDNATLIDSKNQKPVPAMAYVAYGQGTVAAENIIREAEKEKLSPYKPFYDLWIAPAGGKWAYFHYKDLDITGFFGYLLRQLVDLRHFLRILSLKKAIVLFFKDLVIFTKND